MYTRLRLFASLLLLLVLGSCELVGDVIEFGFWLGVVVVVVVVALIWGLMRMLKR